ncbi:ethanolamine utilization protein EutJ [Maledivibacter halophilus]|uniref:Chaperone protein DnaK n=1 Tax=Maledivibacter halophilus TaxID=36842 RepID=A0A1T5MJZ4_9FIRM|nr:ethanolamine utilization protein EutJ [Maledivibacter halophilus]SKC88552.1 ethanolamine utilization protein EutJ [Maledivibacter halophilus]
MLEQQERFEYCNNIVALFEKSLKKLIKKNAQKYYIGVDLGTACTAIAVFDEEKKPVAGAYRWSNVVRDGMVVDYIGAVRIVKEMKEELEEKLGHSLHYAATAIPPGTMSVDGGVVKNVVEGAGFEIAGIFDEPSAANALLKIEDGAIVDIGGGTTGISILKDGKVVYVADEATGGHHFSLALAGAYQMSLEEAEEFKRKKESHQEIVPVLKPVIEKVASIIMEHAKPYDIKNIYLVGGTSCLTGIEKIIEKSTGIATYKPDNPLFVTPLGIALQCLKETEAS